MRLAPAMPVFYQFGEARRAARLAKEASAVSSDSDSLSRSLKALMASSLAKSVADHKKAAWLHGRAFDAHDYPFPWRTRSSLDLHHNVLRSHGVAADQHLDMVDHLSRLTPLKVVWQPKITGKHDLLPMQAGKLHPRIADMLAVVEAKHRLAPAM